PADRLGEAGSRAVQVAVLAQQHVHDLPVLIDGPIQIRPPATPPDVRLIAPPAAAELTGPMPAGLGEEWAEGVDPGQDRAGRHVDAALGEQLDHIGSGQPEAAVPVDGADDDLARPTIAGERSARPRSESPPAATAAISLDGRRGTAVLDDGRAVAAGAGRHHDHLHGASDDPTIQPTTARLHRLVQAAA